MKAQDKKAKKIERAIQIIWDSLDSHLEYVYNSESKEDKDFHKQCVKEYAEVIKIITELY